MATFNFHSASNDHFFIGIFMIWVIVKGTVQPLCSFDWFTPDQYYAAAVLLLWFLVLGGQLAWQLDLLVFAVVVLMFHALSEQQVLQCDFPTFVNAPGEFLTVLEKPAYQLVTVTEAVLHPLFLQPAALAFVWLLVICQMPVFSWDPRGLADSAAVCGEFALPRYVSEVTQPVVEVLVGSLGTLSELLPPHVAVPPSIGSRSEVCDDGVRVVQLILR